MVTVGRLAKAFSLSRTTLLYYDSLGLLVPSGRSANKYRQYSDADVERLRQISVLRDAGLPLKEIKRILDLPSSALTKALEQRLEELNGEIERLRGQQRFILGLLNSDDAHARIRVMNKRAWQSLLTAAGFSEDDRHRWHAEFERQSPEKHQEFLEFLCVPEAQVAEIRGRARAALEKESPSGKPKASRRPRPNGGRQPKAKSASE